VRVLSILEPSSVRGIGSQLTRICSCWFKKWHHSLLLLSQGGRKRGLALGFMPVLKFVVRVGVAIMR